MYKRELKKVMKKSMALLLSVAVFAETVDMRAYATEAEVEITTEVEATEETVAVEESVTVVATESVATEVTESEGETQTTGDVVEESKESLTGETTVETATEEISSVGNTEEETKDLEVEETTVVETTEIETTEIETTEVETTEVATTEEVTETDSTWDGVTTVSVYEAENYTVTFTLNSEWGTGYNASVKIENTGDTVIHDWYLEYASMHTITNIWNAVVYESTDDTCVIKNAGWNQDILAGGSVEFGFSGEGAFNGFPESYQLLGDKTEANTEDYAISYQLNSDWGSGFSGSISITNNTDTTLEDWALEFDFAREITSIWNATIESYEDNHYVMMNAGYNENIGAGQTISFGFNGQGGEATDEPENYKLLQYSLLGADISDVSFDLDVSDMDYQESETGDFYFLSKEKSTLSGVAENISVADTFSYVIEDKNHILCSGEIEKEENWNVANVGFGSGYNLLTISAGKGNQVIEKEYIIINLNLDNVTNLDIDIKQDSDGDGVPDYFEDMLGLDSNSKDTDGDGLEDYIEVVLPNISPTSQDADQDGVLDIHEDCDQDGLTNYDEEYLYGTDLSNADTDSDGLTDKEEVDYGTNPNHKDTDGDGLEDFWEIKIGSNPLVKEDKFTYTKTMDATEEYVTIPTVTVENISAEQVTSFSVERIKENDFFHQNIPGFLDTGYEFQMDGTFEKAVVEISYDKSLENDTFYPALYYYNEETQLLEYVEGQSWEDGKVVASLTHFSKYVLLNKTEYDAVWSYTFLYDEEAESYASLDVAFVIDASGSMSWNDGNNVRKTVTKDFIEKLTESDRAAVISFTSSARTLADFTNDKEVLNSAVNKLGSSGGTSLSAGISRALSLFTSQTGNEEKLKYIIMLTDGVGSYSSTYTTQAANEGIVIYTVGLGSSVSTSVLKNMAEGTGGCYYHVNDAEELYGIFETIAEESDYYKDTDGDGLNDYYEKEMAAGRLVLGTGASLAKIDYLNADSDGDGLLDGEEIEVRKAGEYVYVYLYSNPTKQDTDEDGIDDATDTLPLVANMSELLIHQSKFREGIHKEASAEQNWVAADLTFNDYSYTEIVEEVLVAGTVAGITPEFMMWGELALLFSVAYATCDVELVDSLMDMLDEFRYGNRRNIGVVVGEKDDYQADLYNKFRDEVLTDRSINYPAYDEYVNDVKEIVVKELAKNKGNLLVLEETGSDKDIIENSVLHKEFRYPVFGLRENIALAWAIHDFQGHNIKITNYQCDGKKFSGTIEFYSYDHFGLDNDDYEWFAGFCDWFTLQHYDRFNGKYVPFITVVETSVNFEGVIE